MHRRVTVLGVLFALTVVLGCGGAGATSAPAAATPAAGSIDAAAVTAAVDALQAQPSWTFTILGIQAGTPTAFERNVAGTQRSQPQAALEFTYTQEGQADKRYTQIGDDIWYDVGDGVYVKTTKAEAPGRISDFEPFYLQNLASAAVANGYVYEPVGVEVVSNIETKHYRLTASAVEDVVSNMNLQPAQWAADIWIATNGGYLVRMQWGPQTLEAAQIPMGFDYVVTAVNCSCPVEPPM